MEYWIRAGNNFILRLTLAFESHTEWNFQQELPIQCDQILVCMCFLFRRFLFCLWQIEIIFCISSLKIWNENRSFRSMWCWPWLSLKGRILFGKIVWHSSEALLWPQCLRFYWNYVICLFENIFPSIQLEYILYGVARAQEKLLVLTNNALLRKRRKKKKKKHHSRDLQTHQFRVHECTSQPWIHNKTSALGLELCAATENRIQFPFGRRKLNRYVNEMTKTCEEK